MNALVLTGALCLRFAVKVSCVLLLLTVNASIGGQWQQGNGYRYQQVEPKGKGVGFTRLPSDLTGLNFTNHLSRRLVAINRVTENGSGVALGDVDGDGLCDIYFCRLEGDNALFRNLGGWRFEDVTGRAGVACGNQLSTGAVFVDIDGDGDLDLLANSIGGGTRAFLNNGQGAFTEKQSGLVRRFAATSLALADIDRDGDLDLYVPTYRSIVFKDEMPPLKLEARQVNGKITLFPEGRFAIVAPRGGSVEVSELAERDFFYLNQGNGAFASMSWTNGNFLAETGGPLTSPHLDWGLSAMLRDMNDDTFPDLFVCNDFFNSPDRVWLNEKGVRFRMISLEAITKFSLASMAVDMADINRDGYDDIFVAEMLSRDHGFRQTHRDNIEKANLNDIVSEPNFRPELARNTLYLNRGNGTYAEIAEFSGVDATEWSWGAIFLDVDLDGYEDLLIPTGNNHDVQQMDVLREIRAMRAVDSIPQRMSNLEKFGSLKTPVLAFRNQTDLRFGESGPAWGFDHSAIVNGLACADLDNDGDLDLVGNALNDTPAIYRNESTRPRIAVRLLNPGPNRFGVGAKITVKGGPVQQSQQIIAGGRYLSGDDYIRTFAALSSNLAVTIRWPAGGENTFSNLVPNRIYEFTSAAPHQPEVPPLQAPLFRDTSSLLAHSHKDEPFPDFERQPLQPVKLSALGPGISWFDLDSDGWEDLIIPGGRGGTLSFLKNTQGRFLQVTNGLFGQRIANDQTSALGYFPRAGEPALLLAQSIYETANSRVPSVFCLRAGTNNLTLGVPGTAAATGPIALGDLDRDGDLDLFVGGRVLPGRYPQPVSSRLFRNDNGRFVLNPDSTDVLEGVGMITSSLMADLDGNGWIDLLLATEWGTLRLFLNHEGALRDGTATFQLDRLRGLWNSISLGDFNNDGRPDILAGNWGLNHKFRRYLQAPLNLYYGDMDQNGTFEVVEAFHDSVRQKVFPWSDLDSLTKSIPAVGERFSSYREFSQAGMDQVFGTLLTNSSSVQATWFASTLFLNRGSYFEPVALPAEAQFSPVFGMAVADYNGDGHEDAFLAQNFFGARADQGRLDAGCGLLLLGDSSGRLRASSVLNSGIFSTGEQRGVAVCDFDHDGRPDIALAQNNDQTKLFRNEGAKRGVRIRLNGPPLNPNAIGAQVRLLRAGKAGKTRPILSSSGYWSQDSSTQIWILEEGDQLQVRWPDGKVSTHSVPPSAREAELSPN